ncbi:MAG: universal stress protein [Saprospiraceae bacterium]
MKRILFPTNFSDHTPEVFKYAAELAYFFKADLVVMHALGQPDPLFKGGIALEHMADIAMDRMILMTKDMPHPFLEKVNLDYVTKIGIAADAILRTVLDDNIDLIVMGMTSKTNSIESNIGSVSLEVLGKADCPVLVVPENAQFKGIDNIVFTTNFEFRDLAAINYLRNWSKMLNAPVHCLHVVEDRENEVVAMKNLHILEDTYKGHKKLHFDLISGDLQEEIENFAAGKKADFIAMMSHKRSFISRLLERSGVNSIARHTHIPLLVIKDNAFEWNDDALAWVELANSIA